MDVDLVYLWVDGNDEKWLAKRKPFFEKIDEKTDVGCKGRYINNDELKYSLRSAVKHAPWIRRIFIITDNQKPEWLDTANSKIKIIDLKEIMPQECLPCFNSVVIEYFLYKIPDLAEHFLYACDDMFFNDDLKPDFFFTKDGLPIVRLKRKIFGKWRQKLKFLTGKKAGINRTLVQNASILVKKKFGKYYLGVPHHNIDAYKKSDFRNVIEIFFKEQVENSLTNRIRSKNDLSRIAVSYCGLATGNAVLKYVGKNESFHILVFQPDFMGRLQHYHPKLFCLNDDERATEDDRHRISPFLETLFSEKTEFEK